MDFQYGDLLFFYGRERVSRIIEWATRGPSHVGIISKAYHPHNRPLLFESTTLCDQPCLLTGQKVSGVQAHDPFERLKTYPGKAVRMRLLSGWELDERETYALRDFLVALVDEPYDLRGALISGTRLFKWTALMPYPDLDSLFCSELCAAALMRLFRMPIENPSVYNPAMLMRKLRRWGVYSAPEAIPASLEICQ